MSATNDPTQNPVEKPLATLDVDAIVRIEDHESLRVLIDRKTPSEYRDSVWAVADAETGDFVELVQDGSGVHSEPTIVEFHGNTL